MIGRGVYHWHQPTVVAAAYAGPRLPPQEKWGFWGLPIWVFSPFSPIFSPKKMVKMGCFSPKTPKTPKKHGAPALHAYAKLVFLVIWSTPKTPQPPHSPKIKSNGYINFTIFTIFPKISPKTPDSPFYLYCSWVGFVKMVNSGFLVGLKFTKIHQIHQN